VRSAVNPAHGLHHEYRLSIHHIAVHGSLIHRDTLDPNLRHVYLLSYERQTLIGHFVILAEG